MMVRFVKRNERGLHCRFCGETRTYLLFEVIDFLSNEGRGIVCNNCKEHLKDYVMVMKDKV